MSGPVLEREEGWEKRPAFTTTHWSVVRSAGRRDSAEADAALETLCRTYWYPLYAFIRRRGYEQHDGQDLTQEFFARLLEKDFLRGVDRSKGKFRSFLLAALEHFLANEWRRTRTQKRGGRFTFISFEAEGAEQQYLEAPAADLSPDRFFEQQWALLLLRQALARLEAEFAAADKGAQFAALKIFLTGEKRAGAYAEIADKLAMTEAALKMAVSRLRRRYAEVLRAEIANTVARPDDVEEELRALFAALGA